MYSICDSIYPEPNCDTATVYVTVTSPPIVAVNDTTMTPANTLVNVPVPANDMAGSGRSGYGQGDDRKG